ncbi:MAG: hypothetical protein R2720_00985 [Candidatus Nanopelagicales bacterium]
MKRLEIVPDPRLELDWAMQKEKYLAIKAWSTDELERRQDACEGFQLRAFSAGDSVIWAEAIRFAEAWAQIRRARVMKGTQAAMDLAWELFGDWFWGAP